MKKSLLLFCCVPALALVGCSKVNGTTKVSYDVFHREAVAAAEASAPKTNTIVINGWLESGTTKYTANNVTITETTDYATLSIADLAFASMIAEFKGKAATASDTSGTEYYVGNGFRMVRTEGDDAEIAWDVYLNCTLLRTKNSNGSCEIYASYTYNK